MMFSRTVALGSERIASISARWISRPVPSAACTMREWLWPPSRARSKGAGPPRARVKRAPHSTRRRTACGPCDTKISTRSRRRWPAPAASVSSRCRSIESEGSSTDAMPPCARLVDPAQLSFLVTTSTLPCRAACSANDSPAMPDPTTMKSYTGMDDRS